jgi:hypothetical protein
MHAEIANNIAPASTTANSSHYDQNVLGGFVDYPVDRGRVTVVAYRIENRLSRLQSRPSQSFWSGYVQGELDLRHALRFYGRLEKNGDPARTAYLQNLEPVAQTRAVLGLRWDLGRKQALTFEAARTTFTAGDTNELRLQWSAVFP